MLSFYDNHQAKKERFWRNRKKSSGREGKILEKSKISKESVKEYGQYKHSAQHKLQLYQWKNAKALTNWFTAITDKTNTNFVQFDIKDYHPSITEYTLDRPVELATQHVRISWEDITITKYTCQPLLFHDNKPKMKK